ncbi:Bmh1 14-3-3 family protein (macronuclear) [Tetrahymena thermophila SB210]|uniref:Bmh1 14-3-3 family protein n=1 Tax=Tetrahymena thermophila (strain SB210) TaxID=312017 RepID=I7M2E3_TETTS|nr:Bmh1 14-3-3 family protein [Tetrahymena thermophila SB210]EAS00226.1 Bmh1 14-3-3 family protein [Tetrahymena thermophila SB210]|eukprot:XP_001020471.1 Bmh1 14-3-3 family protein [Tetrahymena thermophila SB210]
MSLSREENIYMGKISEQTERFEDMLEYMKKVVQTGQELSVEERNLLSVAYKNTVGSRRSAWRSISAIQQKEESKGSKHLDLLTNYKKKIETELNLYCEDILRLLNDYLIKNATNAEAQVFFLKMKGDYYRYIAEYAQGDDHKKAADGALDSYNKASEIANSELSTTHPIRLGLALNFSVFHYEVLNDPSKACTLAKTAFDEAIGDIERIQEDQYKDATTIMQLIRDNLTLWTSEFQDDAEEQQE